MISLLLSNTGRRKVPQDIRGHACRRDLMVRQAISALNQVRDVETAHAVINLTTRVDESVISGAGEWRDQSTRWRPTG